MVVVVRGFWKHSALVIDSGGGRHEKKWTLREKRREKEKMFLIRWLFTRFLPAGPPPSLCVPARLLPLFGCN